MRVHVPRGAYDNIVPDMRYGGEEGHNAYGDLLLEHNGVYGADVAITQPVPRSWIKEIRRVKKALGPLPGPFARRLHQIADRAAGQLKVKILRAIASTLEGVSQSTLERALSRGDAEAAMRAIPWSQTGDPQLRAAFQATLEPVYRDAGDAAADQLDRSLKAGLSFNMRDPRSERWAETFAATRVTEVSGETVDAIRQVITTAFTEGRHPYETAKDIREIVGLTTRQADAVRNYRTLLEQDEIERTTEQEDRMVWRYREQLLAARAENIARTETLRAEAEGKQALFDQARDLGYLRDTDRRVWVASEDERTCPICADLDGQEVPLGQPFVGADGERYDLEPAHPQCRCTTWVQTEPKEEDER